MRHSAALPTATASTAPAALAGAEAALVLAQLLTQAITAPSAMALAALPAAPISSPNRQTAVMEAKSVPWEVLMAWIKHKRLAAIAILGMGCSWQQLLQHMRMAKCCPLYMPLHGHCTSTPNSRAWMVLMNPATTTWQPCTISRLCFSWLMYSLHCPMAVMTLPPQHRPAVAQQAYSSPLCQSRLQSALAGNTMTCCPVSTHGALPQWPRHHSVASLWSGAPALSRHGCSSRQQLAPLCPSRPLQQRQQQQRLTPLCASL